MRQVLLEWRGVRACSYPVMLYLGLVAGIAAGTYAANLADLDAASVLAALVVLVIPALVGSKLLFVATHWEVYRAAPERLWRRRSEGGGAMWGGLPLAMLVSVPLLGALRVPFWAFWDVATVTMLVGMIFTRVGCLLHGCCAGRPTESRIGLYLPDHRGRWRRRLPTQLLEAGWATVILVSAITSWGRTPFPGALFLGALAGYAAGRLFIEQTRDTEDQPSDLEVQQAISAAFVVLALTGFVLLHPEGRPPERGAVTMIDWFVSLMPLAVLPIVLFFGFVGCDLEDTPEGAGEYVPPDVVLTLCYDARAAEIASGVQPTFTLIAPSGAKLKSVTSIFPVDVDPAGGSISLTIPDSAGVDMEKVKVQCNCQIVKKSGEPVTPPKPVSKSYIKSDSCHFNLSHEPGLGGDFVLE
jgi:phosphatidylglycerol---prolipoprotein diacylglyceryl transferase